jgi:hypothetical protein
MMTKDAYYFSHDSNAFNDPKIIRLRAQFGLEGYGFYWAVIEMMRNQSDYCLHKEELDLLPFYLHSDDSKIKQMLSKCYELELLEKDTDKVFSISLLRRMEKANKIRVKRAEAGSKGGKAKANAKQTPSKSVALKESKGKEKKEEVKEIKETKETSLPDCIDVDLWSCFVDARKANKKEMTEEAKKRAIKKLEGFECKALGAANISLDNSIVSGWAGVFMPKDDELPHGMKSKSTFQRMK